MRRETKWFSAAIFALFFTVLTKWILQQMSGRSFPSSEYIPGFARTKGVPDTKLSKPYFSASQEAIKRCAENPFCVGVSSQRLFFTEESRAALKRGETVFTVHGQPGESHTYVKDLYPTIFR